MTEKVALITGAAHRIGNAIAGSLHDAGYRIVVHYQRSAAGAQTLVRLLNGRRPDSAVSICQDLRTTPELPVMVSRAAEHWGRLDVLVNNASRFFPTPMGSVIESQWADLLDTNLKAPFFLAQAALPFLQVHGGSVINLIDIYADRGLEDHAAYCISKAGLATMTRLLAKEFAPRVRVNGVAPGAILWPEGDGDAERQQRILSRIPMGRQGEAQDVALAVRYLVDQAPYVTGQILAVDGGRSLVG